jgi:Spy/CpxP family protein refolding chaperone
MKRRIILATVVLGACLFMAFALSAQEKQQAPESKASAERLTRGSLDLTADQQAKLEAMRKAHQEQNQAFQDEMNKLRDEFRSLRDDPKADPKKADALIDRMAKVRTDQMKAGIRHRRDFEGILTPEQRAKMARFHDRLREHRDRGRGFGATHWNRGFGRGLFQGFQRGFERGFSRIFGRPGIFHQRHYRPAYRHGDNRWWRY